MAAARLGKILLLSIVLLFPRSMPGLSSDIFTIPAVSSNVSVTVVAVGDILLHGPLQRQGINEGFRSLWLPVEPWLRTADVSTGNLEGVIAEGVAMNGQERFQGKLEFDQWIYTSYPMFNYPPTLSLALATSGFDVLSTANNHSLDRYAIGSDRTIESLARTGLLPSGTRFDGDPPSAWVAFTDTRGVRLAWIACTTMTNGIEDRLGQVLNCEDQDLPALIRQMRTGGQADGVIVMPHWGNEYDPVPSQTQRDLAKTFAAAGATAIIGSHPHVLQPWEVLTTAAGETVFVAYSLGNFVSNQRQLPRRTSILLFLGLGIHPDGHAFVAAVRYLPIHVVFEEEAGYRATVTPAWPAAQGPGSPLESWCLAVAMYGLPWLHPPLPEVMLRPDGTLHGDVADFGGVPNGSAACESGP